MVTIRSERAVASVGREFEHHMGVVQGGVKQFEMERLEVVGNETAYLLWSSQPVTRFWITDQPQTIWTPGGRFKTGYGVAVP